MLAIWLSSILIILLLVVVANKELLDHYIELDGAFVLVLDQIDFDFFSVVLAAHIETIWFTVVIGSLWLLVLDGRTWFGSGRLLRYMKRLDLYSDFVTMR